MIVGTKTECYFTASRVVPKPWDLVHHEVKTELHSTKGWRRISHRRQRTRVMRLPDQAAWRAADVTTFKLNPDHPPRDRGCAAIPITEKMLMRHGWYRKKFWEVSLPHRPEENRV